MRVSGALAVLAISLLAGLAPASAIERGFVGNASSPSLAEDLSKLHANCAIVFTPGRDPVTHLTRTIKECRARGISVFMDGGARDQTFRRLGEDKKWQLINPSCYNGPYADAWEDYLVRMVKQFRFDVMSLTTDEVYWANAQLRYTFRVSPGSDVPFYCQCEHCKRGFREKCGFDLPKPSRSRILHDSAASRAFVLFRYESVARALARFDAVVRRANPGCKTGVVFSAVPVYALERYPSGICYDLIGRNVKIDNVAVTAFPSGWDYHGPESHYWITETAKHFVAAFPSSTVTVVLNNYNCNDPDDKKSAKREIDPGQFPRIRLRKVDCWGNALSLAAHGAAVNCYHLRYALDGYRQDAFRRGYGVIEAIEPWLEGSQIPNTITVLYSRAGEDFFGLRHGQTGLSAEEDGSEAIWGCGGWAQPANRAAWRYNKTANVRGSYGFRTQKAVLHCLLRNGYPFRMHYLDGLQESQLSGSRLIVLPFAYSMTTSAAALLKEAVEAGANLLVFRQLGETDESGGEHAKPLLLGLVGLAAPPSGPKETSLALATQCPAKPVAQLPKLELFQRVPVSTADRWSARGQILHRRVGKGRVIYLAGDFAAHATNPAVRDLLCGLMDHLLGDENPVCLRRPAPDGIEVMVRNKDASRIMFLTNWGTARQKVPARVRVPDGEYRLTGRSVLRDGESALSDKAAYTSQELQDLAIDLAPEETMVILIEPRG